MHSLLTLLSADWSDLYGSPLSHALLVILSAICGILLGLERERKDKPTGTRTLSFVCVGSAVFTLLSEQGRVIDGRIVAQIVSGVGFLGGGVIIHRGETIGGLTSAAMIWLSAAIGVVAGFGYGWAALLLTLFALSVLTLTRFIEKVLFGSCSYTEVSITCSPNGGKTILKIQALLEEHAGSPSLFEEPSQTNALEASPLQLRLQCCAKHKFHRMSLSKLAELPEVLEIKPINDSCSTHNTHPLKHPLSDIAG